MKRVLARGFTLVELLIVIALLGAIAVIVIAAINPIEQANKARDARFRADASQLLSAVERYYASNSKFPWMTDVSDTAEEEFPFVSAQNAGVGLCSASGCSSGGILVTSDELKTEFLGRDWAKTTQAASMINIGKDIGSSSSVYACFIPLSKSAKDTAIKNDVVRALSFTGEGLPSDGTCAASTGVDWATTGCYVCVPE